MAEALGNVVQHWQSKVVAWTESETDTTITVVCDCYWNSIKWGYDTYAQGYADVGGTNGGWKQFVAKSGSGASVSTHIQRTRKTYNKNQNGYNVNCKGVVQLTGGYHNGTSTASVNVWIPARGYVAHGTPSLSVNQVGVLQGETVTLSWSKAATQGNANFHEFQLAMGGKALYNGSGTTFSHKLSDWTGGGGGDFTYTLTEVHEWYGTYPSTSKSVTVHLAQNHGAPTLSTDRAGYYQGERINLSWSKAANQGNTKLARYELWRNGSKLYSGTSTSFSEVAPSNSNVTYTLKEIHEWYGREITTQTQKTVTIMVGFGAPTLTASKRTANYSEAITLNFGRASNQGNSAFNKFELYQGNTKLYSGSGTAYRVVPSDYSGPRGGNVTFKLKEIHEWHGRYPSTETTITINVRSGVVTVYDSSRNKHTGLVTVYDGSGNLRYVLITAYDSSGKPHSVV